ncbi:MAG TPA: 16S rRNA (guanine(966)-N(2))-methyltransferase RsmD [Gammaproteobacteria bacterium]
MKNASHSVRIIGGQWRGRHLPVSDFESLRPSKDIVRETLFNWLQPVIEGSWCLDAFAGSGALGFESASRGASYVLMLERETELVRQLRHQREILKAGQVEVVAADSEQYLRRPGQVFDIVFLDPPFNSPLLPGICRTLSEYAWVKSGSVVYLEAARKPGLPALPDGWELYREKTSGDVAYGLARVL